MPRVRWRPIRAWCLPRVVISCLDWYRTIFRDTKIQTSRRASYLYFRRVKLRSGCPTIRAYHSTFDCVCEEDVTSQPLRLVVLRRVSHPPTILFVYPLQVISVRPRALLVLFHPQGYHYIPKVAYSYKHFELYRYQAAHRPRTGIGSLLLPLHRDTPCSLHGQRWRRAREKLCNAQGEAGFDRGAAFLREDPAAVTRL